ncbi:hypothetical protein KXX11_004323, partial [Aspergillus fumigatus]
HRPSGALPGPAGPVHRGRRGGVARRHPRHVRALRGTAGDEPGDHLFRHRPRDRPHRRRLAVRAPGLAQRLLVPDRRGRAAVERQLQAAARDPAPLPAPALPGPAPAGGLLAIGLQPPLPAAGPGQRRAVQRHVPVCAVGAGLSRPASGPGAHPFLL